MQRRTANGDNGACVTDGITEGAVVVTIVPSNTGMVVGWNVTLVVKRDWTPAPPLGSGPGLKYGIFPLFV